MTVQFEKKKKNLGLGRRSPWRGRVSNKGFFGPLMLLWPGKCVCECREALFFLIACQTHAAATYIMQRSHRLTTGSSSRSSKGSKSYYRASECACVGNPSPLSAFPLPPSPTWVVWSRRCFDHDDNHLLLPKMQPKRTPPPQKYYRSSKTSSFCKTTRPFSHQRGVGAGPLGAGRLGAGCSLHQARPCRKKDSFSSFSLCVEL